MGGRRERLVFWSTAALLVIAAALGYRLLLGAEPGAPRAAQPAPPASPLRLTVAAVSGEVTVVRAGARTRAAAGDELRADDSIETAVGARVTLAAEGYEVALEEAAAFDVREITAELSRFRLAQGLASTRVREDAGRAVEIEGAPGTSVRTRGGDVAVGRSGDSVAVGVQRGSAEFAAAGGTVLLRAGQQSHAAPGTRPSPPAPLPESLLLKVSWPEARTTNQRRIVVTGRTEPGTVVVLGDERVEVQRDGRFTHVISLREGRQRLSARAHGVAGSTSADGPAILLDTRAPDPRFDTRDLWAKPRR